MLNEINSKKKKKQGNFIRFLRIYSPKFIIGLFIGLFLSLIFVFSKMLSASIDLDIAFISAFNILYVVDGLFFGGLIVIFIGLFSYMTNRAFFDIFAYNGVRFMNFLKQYKTPNIYGTYEYTQSKKEKRSFTKWTFLSYICSGVCILVAFLISYFVIY